MSTVRVGFAVGPGSTGCAILHFVAVGDVFRLVDDDVFVLCRDTRHPTVPVSTLFDIGMRALIDCGAVYFDRRFGMGGPLTERAALTDRGEELLRVARGGDVPDGIEEDDVAMGQADDVANAEDPADTLDRAATLLEFVELDTGVLTRAEVARALRDAARTQRLSGGGSGHGHGRIATPTTSSWLPVAREILRAAQARRVVDHARGGGS